MALKRITMQDIANACGLSRNTVSKVFNGRGSVPDHTRRLVISKARELGYYQLPLEDAPVERPGGTIAILTQHKLLSHDFGAFFITSFSDQISRAGYTMQMYEVSPEEIAIQALPSLFDIEQTAGILGIELFDRSYIDMVCSLDKPTIFVDGYPRANETLIECDFITMENITSEMTIVKRMISGGAKKLGFVGDIEHCNSFYERWLGFCAALGEAELPIDRRLSILAPDGDYYGYTDWLLEQLEAMPCIPDAFACANDFLAIHLMTALKQLGIAVPADVMVTGFGGSLEAELIEPSLTTAYIPSKDIGRLAATLLTRRIQLPDTPFTWTAVKTTPVRGDSTC